MRPQLGFLAILATSAMLVSPVVAQDVPRLVDCIEAPYAYVSLDCSAGGAGNDAGAQAQAGVQRLLADPALDAVLAGTSQAGEANAPAGSSKALKLVRGLLGRGVGELELVMTGIVGGGEQSNGGQPLLILRARLQADAATRMRGVLEKSSELMPERRLGERQTYRLSGGGRGPGELVELALVGADLIVGNDSSAMREVLVPQPQRTSATATRKVLSADRRFKGLKQRMELPAGSLLAYGDWERLGRRLQSTMTGAPAQLLESSGLGNARSVMMTIAPASNRRDGEGFDATLLLDFGSRVERGLDIDGWFASTEPVAAKQLLRELPRGGLGGLVLSVDLAAVASSSPRSSHMVWDVREAFSDYGLDFDRNVLARLGARGTVQLHFGKTEQGSPAFAAIAPVYSLRAKNRKAANDLFGDLCRVVAKTDLGERIEARDSKGKRIDVLRLQGRVHDFTAHVAVHDGSLLLAQDQATLVQVYEELRRNKPRRRNQLAVSTIQSIGGSDVAGLFDVDLDPVLRHIASAFAGVDVTALPKRHVGYLDIDRRDDSSVVRIRVLSSR